MLSKTVILDFTPLSKSSTRAFLLSTIDGTLTSIHVCFILGANRPLETDVHRDRPSRVVQG